jgi:hypothetical protein
MVTWCIGINIFSFLNNTDDVLPIDGPIDNVQMDEVRDALRGMTREKATGPSGMSSE